MQPRHYVVREGSSSLQSEPEGLLTLRPIVFDDQMEPSEPQRDQYTVGWICALPIEAAVSKAMLDKRYRPLSSENASDSNNYALGSIGEHNVVIASLPTGVYGTTSAATTATKMLASFPSIRFGLLVGIGGGIPSEERDVRCGDVVVSKPHGTFGMPLLKTCEDESTDTILRWRCPNRCRQGDWYRLQAYRLAQPAAYRIALGTCTTGI